MSTTIATPAPVSPEPENENQLIDLRQALRLFPLVNGKPVKYDTLYNWSNRGTYGIKLATTRIGRIVVTTPKAVREFLAQCAKNAK